MWLSQMLFFFSKINKRDLARRSLGVLILFDHDQKKIGKSKILYSMNNIKLVENSQATHTQNLKRNLTKLLN